MKRTIIGFLAALALLGITGCNWVGVKGNGKIVTTERATQEFNEISVSGGLTIEWQSGPPSVSVTTDENIQPLVQSWTAGKVLHLRMRRKVWPTAGIKITLSSPALQGADLSGVVDLKTTNLSGPKFYMRARGFSDVTLNGNVDVLLADLTGAGDLNARGLQTRTAQISTAGAADTSITVSETLRVSIMGAGDVTYWGNPKTIEKHIAGAGSVSHKK